MHQGCCGGLRRRALLRSGAALAATLPLAGCDAAVPDWLADLLVPEAMAAELGAQAFREILRPGATLAVHEYSVRDSRLASGIWDAVCWGIIIPSGWRQTRDSTLYRHLWRSVKTFDGAADFQRRIAAAAAIGSPVATSKAITQEKAP